MADEIQNNMHQEENTEKEQLLGDAVPSELETKLAECENKRDEYLSGWQRAKADFLNYKREESERFQNIALYANQGIVEEIIRVLDSFDLGIAALEKQGPVEKGIYMIRVQLEDILKRQGVTKIVVKAGTSPDLAKQEVVGEVESDLPPGTLVEEIEAGYMLHDKVLRPVRIRTAKPKGQ